MFLKFGKLNPVDYVQMLGDPAQIEDGEVVRPVEASGETAPEPLDATYKELLETVF